MNAKLAWTVARFIELAPRRAELGGNAAFRKAVTHELSEAFDGCSLTSAANYYNQAKKIVTETHPELVEGLGRSADAKKGGAPVRFPHSVIDVDGNTVAQGLSRAAAVAMVKASPDQQLKVVSETQDPEQDSGDIEQAAEAVIATTETMVDAAVNDMEPAPF